MSRIGNAPILIPAGITVEKTEGRIIVNGEKGRLETNLDSRIEVDIKDGQVLVSRKNEEKATKAMHGLTRALIANMVLGVEKGWSKNLELSGVGFRAQTDGSKLTLTIGFSHPVDVQAPEGIQFEVKDNTRITVSGIDKQLVGETSAKIRAIKPPEPYKGKGIRYEGEYIRRKAGKAGKVGAAGAGK
ncbi:MAG: large subunit ribosomal protein L6 [Microgenomates group bacterium Gr01-1014_80]|nr:MAG: large subunit ribosomal protein L6 [Microgenomates group bacterium Gr01-1014_80]